MALLQCYTMYVYMCTFIFYFLCFFSFSFTLSFSIFTSGDGCLSYIIVFSSSSSSTWNICISSFRSSQVTWINLCVIFSFVFPALFRWDLSRFTSRHVSFLRDYLPCSHVLHLPLIVFSPVYIICVPLSSVPDRLHLVWEFQQCPQFSLWVLWPLLMLFDRASSLLWFLHLFNWLPVYLILLFLSRAWHWS